MDDSSVRTLLKVKDKAGISLLLNVLIAMPRKAGYLVALATSGLRNLEKVGEKNATTGSCREEGGRGIHCPQIIRVRSHIVTQTMVLSLPVKLRQNTPACSALHRFDSVENGIMI